MADESRSSENETASADNNEIVVTASPEHPAESRSVEVSPDGKIGVNVPCPVVDHIGPVSLTCGAGVSTFDLAAYGQVRATMPMEALVPLDALSGFRLIAQVSGVKGAQGDGSDAFIGVASPPIRPLGGISIAAGVDPTNGQPTARVYTRF